MSEFLTLLPPPDALAKLLAHVQPLGVREVVDSAESLHRTLAQPITAPFSLPAFPRSTVDGYAVRPADTHGASETLPAYLTSIAEVSMGGTPSFTLQKEQCALIHTGGMVPNGADAVVMVEQTQHVSGRQSAVGSYEVEILRSVAHGENVLQVGEDVREGDVVLEAGTLLRSAEIGGLMALGHHQVTVAKRPRIGILSSGDEVVPPNQPLQHGQVYDINSYTLRALVQQAGGIAVNYPIIPDEAEAFRVSAERALAENDVVVFTAGSSVSVRDLTAQTIDALGTPGVLVHGVNVRPGKPTILAVCNGKPVIGLPGNPVSALVIARIFVTAVIERLTNTTPRPQPAVPATLRVNLASDSGREDWVAVKLVKSAETIYAEPVFGKSNLIFTLARADGLIRIHPHANGLAAGTPVEVQLF